MRPGSPWAVKGGSNLDIKNATSTTASARSTQSQVVGRALPDYIPHHNWFQDDSRPANPSATTGRAWVANIGFCVASDGKTAEPANHEYDLRDFYLR